MRAALAFDHRRIAQEFRDAGAVERRRHRRDAEILAQALSRVERERQAQIGIERALVKLVEQNGGDAGKLGVVDQRAGEHALGHHLDAGLLRHPRIEADAEAHRLADRLAERPRHAGGGGARG